MLRRLNVVHAYDLIDPSDERRHLDVDAGHVYSAAAEAPRHQAGQLKETVVLTHQRSTAVTLKHATNERINSSSYAANQFSIVSSIPDTHRCLPRRPRRNSTPAK